MVAGLRANAAAVNPVPYSELIMDSGIALRSSGIAPDRFIAVFYTGLGASLLLAGPSSAATTAKPWQPSKKARPKGRTPSFNQTNHYPSRQRRTHAGPRATYLSGALRRTKEPPPHEVRSGGSFMSEDAPERKVALGPNS